LTPDLPPFIQPAWDELQKSIVYVTISPTPTIDALAVFVMVSAAATISTQFLFIIVETSLGNSLEVKPVPFVQEISAKLQ
jgi:hypothetical protein